jgi:hypothetical protein
MKRLVESESKSFFKSLKDSVKSESQNKGYVPPQEKKWEENTWALSGVNFSKRKIVVCH